MTWMIGIDEAGYGPNLGPLCVAATAWKTAAQTEGGKRQAAGNSSTLAKHKVDLFQQLEKIICTVPDGERIAIADSKQLYKPGGGLRQLERGVLSALCGLPSPTPSLQARGTEGVAFSWNELLEATRADADNLRFELPWYQDFNCDLPLNADVDEIKTLANMFAVGCEDSGVELLGMQSRMIFPPEFNSLTEHYGTKGAALSHISIGLLRSTLETLTSGPDSQSPVHITCDKHGGRNRYAALLQHHFSDYWIETIEESRAVSRYRFGEHEICFRTKGEAELPVALASMTAKYQRELAMKAFNEFWRDKLPDLRPTAGYPVDAKRFKSEIAGIQSKLGIDDALLWRTR